MLVFPIVFLYTVTQNLTLPFLIIYNRKFQYFELTFLLRPTSAQHTNNHIACLYAVLCVDTNALPAC